MNKRDFLKVSIGVGVATVVPLPLWEKPMAEEEITDSQVVLLEVDTSKGVLKYAVPCRYEHTENSMVCHLIPTEGSSNALEFEAKVDMVIREVRVKIATAEGLKASPLFCPELIASLPMQSGDTANVVLPDPLFTLT